MADDPRERRRNEIMDAALAVLSQKGYRDASMLDVARRAAASKETLYAWFGDKQGLFEALIRRNAAVVQAVLDRHLDGDEPLEAMLTEFGAALLRLLLSDGAVAINRAAVSEAMSEPALARTLAAAGRDAVLPNFTRLLQRHAVTGRLAVTDADRAAQDFLGLLLGDVQVRRLLGVAPEPSAAAIAERARHAADAFLKLHARMRPQSG